jgi:hypothetical protein
MFWSMPLMGEVVPATSWLISEPSVPLADRKVCSDPPKIDMEVATVTMTATRAMLVTMAIIEPCPDEGINDWPVIMR